MIVSDAIRNATLQLESTSPTARLDAELLMAHAMQVSRSDMLLRHMDDPIPEHYFRWIKRRAAREPVAYIVGEQEFYGRPFKVTRDTLIPRADSEVIVEAALELLGEEPENPHDGVLDLGTGTGALLLSILAERPAYSGHGIDLSEAALAVAKDNAAALGLADRADFFVSGWHAEPDSRDNAWWDVLGQYELVIANPPYVEVSANLEPSVRDYEPHDALFAGVDGLDDYAMIIPGLRYITSQAVLEIGATQAEAVTQMAEAEGFAVEVRHDLANRPRALILKW